MKEYICLNHINCAWADEIPPRKFVLASADDPCPECGKFNVGEVKDSNGFLIPWKSALPIIVGAILIGLLIKYFLSISSPIKGIASPPPTSKINSSTSTIGKSTSQTVGKNDNKQKGGNSAGPQSTPSTVTWTKVKDSDFCISDCIVEYTEEDNLGHTRKRTISNYDKCCPAEN